MYVHYVFLQLLLLAASVSGQQWPACPAGSLRQQQQAGGRVITISDPSACTLSISSGGSSSSNGSTAGSEPQLVLVLGAQNSSLGRPNAVQLVAAPAGAAGAVDLGAGAPHDGFGTAAAACCCWFAPGHQQAHVVVFTRGVSRLYAAAHVHALSLGVISRFHLSLSLQANTHFSFHPPPLARHLHPLRPASTLPNPSQAVSSCSKTCSC